MPHQAIYGVHPAQRAVRRFGWPRAAGVLAALLGSAAPACAQFSVLTHHDDAMRTGWNAHETTLTHAALETASGRRFGLLRTVPVDSLVTAQPLVVPQTMAWGGTRDVVYVATEANTVYAIDAATGAVLMRRSLGAAVVEPTRCSANVPTVGIDGTPVIDLESRSLYLIAYVQEQVGPEYYLHRLSLADLSDVMPPRRIAAAATLADNSLFRFNPSFQHQHAALLLNHGVVYAGFGSFCDHDAFHSRGWVLGWDAATLAPLRLNDGGSFAELTSRAAAAVGSSYLASVWMSGAGIAAGGPDDIYFVTGNAAANGGNHADGSTLSESVVRLWPSQQLVTSRFTPTAADFMDRYDRDFGSGGVVLLPRSIPGLPPRLAVAAGKLGTMYLMNRDSLGGYAGAHGRDQVVGAVPIGPCWCEPSVFDPGTPTIVSSGGGTLQLWTLAADPAAPLVPGPHATLPHYDTDDRVQDGGFFTSVSSNGTRDPVIWAIGRPTTDSPTQVTLYAYEVLTAPARLVRVFAEVAGTWPIRTANANVVPVVANGRVYVASDKELRIFGLAGE